MDSALHIYKKTEGFELLHELSARKNVKGFMEIPKAAINPLIMESALLDKDWEDQYMIQSCKPPSETLPKKC